MTSQFLTQYLALDVERQVSVFAAPSRQRL
jgi:hypothetical protein